MGCAFGVVATATGRLQLHEDPLGGSELSASLAYEGGPAVEDVQDARLIGLASWDVATVQLLMSDGTLVRCV